MSVPLDRLYNFLHDHCNHDIIIYRWNPHGSRKIGDCTPLTLNSTPMDQLTHIFMVCHDQEPLDPSIFPKPHPATLIPGVPYSVLHLTGIQYSAYDRILLLHSEKRSDKLEWFEQDGAIGVYYWSHALIARDWFRYAEVDPKINYDFDFKYDFLIYNRAWCGTREYRLKFAELLINQGVASQCLMNFSQCDPESYMSHVFDNEQLAISRFDLENHFAPNAVDASASADYAVDDYLQCGIEVVLETLFDDSRLHLTEKVFRPIACKKPFILAATQGSLAYIRSYGFKTFGDFIDERYDDIADPVERLKAIVNVMETIAKLPVKEKQQLWLNMNAVCEYNHSRFFSSTFHSDVVNEYKSNLDLAVKQMPQYRHASYFKKVLKLKGSVDKILNTTLKRVVLTRENLVDFWKFIKQEQG